MRRMLKLVISVSLIICLCILPCVSPCFASEPYTFTITVLSGEQGNFGGEDSVTYSGLEYGSIIDLSNAVSSVNVLSDKYYVKGIRLSGHDNSELSSPAVTVTKDEIYVIAYGIKGDMVNYTVKFQDASGNELADAVSGTGQIGDKPVVAYKYINGYTPNAYNLSKTLSADESSNIFTFTYTKKTTQNNWVVVYNYTDTDTEEESEDTATGIEELEESATQDIITQQETSDVESAPLDMIDLDDPNVPLANVTDKEINKETAGKVLIAIGGIALIALIAITIYCLKNRKILFKRKKTDKEEETDN